MISSLIFLPPASYPPFMSHSMVGSSFWNTNLILEFLTQTHEHLFTAFRLLWYTYDTLRIWSHSACVILFLMTLPVTWYDSPFPILQAVARLSLHTSLFLPQTLFSPCPKMHLTKSYSFFRTQFKGDLFWRALNNTNLDLEDSLLFPLILDLLRS